VRTQAVTAFVLQAKPFGENHRSVLLLTDKDQLIRAMAFKAGLPVHPLYAVIKPLAQARFYLVKRTQDSIEILQGQSLVQEATVMQDPLTVSFLSLYVELILAITQAVGEASTNQVFCYPFLVVAFDAIRTGVDQNGAKAACYLLCRVYEAVGLGDNLHNWQLDIPMQKEEFWQDSLNVTLHEFYALSIEEAELREMMVRLSVRLEELAGLRLRSLSILQALWRPN
jgi:hypothetical protein